MIKYNTVSAVQYNLRLNPADQKGVGNLLIYIRIRIRE